MTYKVLRILEFTVLASISGDKHGILIWLERLKWKLTYLEGKNFGTLTSDRLIQIPLYLWWRMELFRMSSVILPFKTVRNWGYGESHSTLKPPKRMSYFLVLFQTHWLNTFKIDIPNRYLNYFNYFANVRAGKEQKPEFIKHFQRVSLSNELNSRTLCKQDVRIYIVMDQSQLTMRGISGNFIVYGWYCVFLENVWNFVEVNTNSLVSNNFVVTRGLIFHSFSLRFGSIIMANENTDRDAQLSCQIQEKFSANQQTPKIYDQKDSWRREMELIIQELYPSCRLVLCGSSANGFGSTDSDIDLILTAKSREDAEAYMLRRIESLFTRTPRRFETRVRSFQSIESISLSPWESLFEKRLIMQTLMKY